MDSYTLIYIQAVYSSRECLFTFCLHAGWHHDCLPTRVAAGQQDAEGGAHLVPLHRLGIPNRWVYLSVAGEGEGEGEEEGGEAGL
jgi:hypothetical protein